jgi:uncharacterized protein (DUF1778 family)
MKSARINTSIRISRDTRDAMKEAAEADTRSLSNLIEHACRRWLAERQTQKGPHAGGPFNL